MRQQIGLAKAIKFQLIPLGSRGKWERKRRLPWNSFYLRLVNMSGAQRRFAQNTRNQRRGGVFIVPHIINVLYGHGHSSKECLYAPQTSLSCMQLLERRFDLFTRLLQGRLLLNQLLCMLDELTQVLTVNGIRMGFSLALEARH